MSASIGTQVAFWTLSGLAVGSALMMLVSRKAVHAALWVALAMINLAGLYVMQGAVFLGVVQVVVYTGAIMMLFLFVLMLVGVDASDSLVETLRGQRVAGVLLGVGFGVLLVGLLSRATLGEPVGIEAVNSAAGGNVQAIAEGVFGRYIWAFEVIGALLVTAAVGAMVLAYRERLEPKLTQREMAERRIRSGRFSPLPNPGVFARNNSVDTPALLPDGTVSPESVPEQLGEPRSVTTDAEDLQRQLDRGEDE